MTWTGTQLICPLVSSFFFFFCNLVNLVLLLLQEAACGGPSLARGSPEASLAFNSKGVEGLLCLGLRLGRVCVFSGGRVCVHARSFSSDLSLPRGHATLICSAITQISQPRQITDLLLHIDLPGRTQTHNICVLWRLVGADILLIRVLWLVVHVGGLGRKLLPLWDPE